MVTKIILSIAVMLLVGCSAKVSTSVDSRPTTQQPVADNGIEEFQLKDGTRCVTVYSRGITCDWAGAKATEQEPAAQ